MIQIELYVDGVDEPAEVFVQIFGFDLIQSKAGWRTVQYKGQCQVMLFDPATSDQGVPWTFLSPNQTGHGVQIVVTVADAAEKRLRLQDRGYECSPLAVAPWGSLEFEFRLQQGYLIRVKQQLA